MTTSGNPRLRRRNQLFLVGAIPALVLLVVAVQFALMVKANRDGRSAYDAQLFDDAETSFSDGGGPVEGWIPPFGAGGAAFRAGRFADATAWFEDALRDAPKDRACEVRVNLALTHEALADQLAATKEPKKAREEYAAGRAALGDCDDGVAEDVERRLLNKAGRTGDAASATQPSELAPEEKLDKLQQSNDAKRRESREPEEPEPEEGVQIEW